MPKNQKKDDSEQDVFFDTWLKRSEAIEVLRSKNQQIKLEEIIRTVMKRSDQDEEDDFKRRIQMDFHLDNFRFCFSNNFSAEQISTFISIVHYVFYLSLEKKLAASDSFDRITKIVSRHTSQVPPFAVAMFSESEKEAIFVHVRGIYKFFLMYEISLTTFIDYNIHTLDPFKEYEDGLPLSHGIKIGSIASDGLEPEDIEKEEVLKQFFAHYDDKENEEENEEIEENQLPETSRTEAEEEKKKDQLEAENEKEEQEKDEAKSLTEKTQENDDLSESQVAIRALIDEKLQKERKTFEENILIDLDDKIEAKLSNSKKGVSRKR